jgi:soluble lytic murein transglycosylase-like protein
MSVEAVGTRIAAIESQIQALVGSPAAAAAFDQALTSASAAGSAPGPTATAASASGTAAMPAGMSAPATAGGTLGAGGPTQFDPMIQSAAARYGLDPALLKGLIRQESGFDPNAGSPAGAQGLTQLMPGTAAGLGVTDPLDPAQSIEGGAKYLSQQLERFGGDVARALAAYNAGPGAVQRFGGVPPYAETQNYVRVVQSNAAAFRAGSSSASIT